MLGSLLLTFYGLDALGGWGELRGAARSGDVQPVEAAGTRRRRRHVGAGEGSRAASRWYFNGDFPWLGMLLLRADHRPLVLVHRPVHRPARARRARTRREARRGTIFAAFLKLLPVFIFIIPGMIALALAQERPERRAGVASSDANGQCHARRRRRPRSR